LTPEFGSDEKINLVRIFFTGEVDIENYAPLTDFSNSLSPEKKTQYLVDVSRLGNSLWGKKTGKVVTSATERIKESRIAIIGVSAFSSMLSKTIAAAMERLKDTNFFKPKMKPLNGFVERRKNDSRNVIR
jgi:hypothetical protein